MKTKSLIFNLLSPFKTFRITNEAKQSLLRSITSILLTQNGATINDLQYMVQHKEDNLYMILVEPLAYLFTNKEEPTLTRYYA
jgi:FMN-dependent NADH-azoreductase